MNDTHLNIRPDAPWLAPLAGYSDLPFRILCRENGCHVAVTEMVSAKGLIYNSPGTRELLQTNASDSPLVVQLFGSEEYFLLKALEQLQKDGYRYFDLNCGCSVRKVTKTGSGAALLKDPQLLLNIATSMIQKAEPGCMGFKIRLGWSHDNAIFLKLAQALEQLGAGWLALHPRYATQGFSGNADWTHLTALKNSVSIPVIASGDLFSAEDAIACVRQTGVDGVMFARGALNDPRIFVRYTQMLNNLMPEAKSRHDMISISHRLYSLYNTFNMAKTGILKMRTLVPKFFKGLENAKSIRRDIVACSSWEDVQSIISRTNDFEE